MNKIYLVEFIFNTQKKEDLVDFTLTFSMMLPESTRDVIKKAAYEEAFLMDIPSQYEYIKSFKIISEEIVR